MFFDIESGYLDRKLYTIDNKLNELSVNMYEALANEHQITESVANASKSTFKQIIATIVSWFMSLKTQLLSSLKEKMREKEMVDHIKKLREEIKQSPDEKVTVTNIWYIEGTFVHAVNELTPYIEAMGKMNFNSVSELDKVLDTFYNKLEKWNGALERASKEKTTITKAKMLTFLDKELNGRSDVFDTINRCMKMLEKLESDARITEKRLKIAGDSVIPEHVSIFRKAIIRFTSFIKKWCVKIITLTTLIIG